MKVKVLIRFHDKNDFTKVYEVDEVVEFEAERVSELLKLSLIEELKEDFSTNKPLIEELNNDKEVSKKKSK